MLREFVNTAPPIATHLKLTIDGPNAHAEANEQNNIVLLPVLRTDFAITDAEQRDGLPWFKYHNRGNLGLGENATLSFWLEWVDEQGERIGELYWFDTKPPSVNIPRESNFSRDTVLYSSKAPRALGDFLDGAPPAAKYLKIAIDGPNTSAQLY